MSPDDRQHMRLLLAARLSSKTGIGIETQDQYGREWAEREGHTIVAVVADIKSGTVAPWDRPKLKPWVTRPDKMQEYDGILAYKNDRLSRGEWDDEIRIRQWASDNGKVLVIVDGPQWPPRGDADFWSWTAQAKQANAEWLEMQERNKRARRALIESGALVGQVPTWAFTIIGEKYSKQAIPTDAGRSYIPQIFQRIADGDSLAKVADWARSQGVGSGKISARTIARIIRNRIYMGHRHFALEGKETVLKVEPLVDAKLWTQANARLDNSPRGRRGPTTGNPALLTSILFCSRCPREGKHAPMYRICAWGGYFYRCAGHFPERKGCGNLVNLAFTDAAVIVMLSMSHVPWKDLRSIPGENHDIELAEIKLAIRDLGAQDLPDDEHDAELSRLRAERDRLAALPNVPDDWKEVEICGTCGGSEYLETCGVAGHHKVTVGEHFKSLDYDGQRAMLLESVKLQVESVDPPIQPEFTHIPIIRLESRLFKMPVEWIGSGEPVTYLGAGEPETH